MSGWKGSIIVSSGKPGKEHWAGVDKYRPISLLFEWGKILEKRVYKSNYALFKEQ